jgi:ElaA protein
MPNDLPAEVARFVDLSAATLYEILALRAQVFVVEQACAYLDVDGRDREPGTLHVFVRDRRSRDGGVVAYLRILREPDGTRKIGRVVATPAVRGVGVAGALMHEALAHVGREEDVVLDAQAPLAGWYAAFGFEVAGAEFLEDGIPHVPMRRVRR